MSSRVLITAGWYYSTHNVVVFVSARHPFFERDSISIQELKGKKVVQREVGSTTRTAMEQAPKKYQVSIDVILDIGSREGIWKAVEQGLGIGFVADFEFVPHPNLRAIPIKGAGVSTKYFLAFLKERKNSNLIRAFCDVVQRGGIDNSHRMVKSFAQGFPHNPEFKGSLDFIQSGPLPPNWRSFALLRLVRPQKITKADVFAG